MYFRPSVSRAHWIMLLAVAGAGLAHGGTVAAATVEYPSQSCTQQFFADGSGQSKGYASTTYICPIPASSATKSLKVVMYYSWFWVPLPNSADKPLDTTVSCYLTANDRYRGENFGAVVTASVTLPTTKAVLSYTNGQLVLPSLPTANAGFSLACTMPYYTVTEFISGMGSFKVISQ